METGLVTSSKQIKTLSTRSCLKAIIITEVGFSFSFLRNARFIRPTYPQSKLLIRLRCGCGLCLSRSSLTSDIF